MASATELIPAKANPTVLSVDDEALHNEDLSWRLRRAGYRVELAESGSDALARIAEGGIDAVLLDINLQGAMTGLDVLREVRATADQTELPIIMVTAGGDEETVIGSLELGANDYLTKPVRFPIALARLKTQIALAHAFAQLRECALHDPLTGLANRVLIDETITQAVARASRAGNTFALVLLDLDDFKRVNDEHGHAAGDALLIAIAERLGRVVRESDTVGRLGGDEFILVLEGLDRPEQIDFPLQRLHAAMAKPFTVQGHAIQTGASIGHCLWNGRRDCDTDAMLHSADLDMYAQKSARKAVAG